MEDLVRNLTGFGGLLIAIGWLVYAIGSVKYRKADAPIWGHSGRGWPLGHREWFSTKGHRLRVVGFSMVIVGGLMAVAALVIRYA